MTDQTDAPNEVKIHVTIDREQVSEAARLAAELFITEYASRLVEAVDPNYLDDEPVEDCGRPPRVHVNPERADWLDEPIPVPRPEPVDITEEPPVGSQVTDKDGDVWERREEGWTLWSPDRPGWLADPYESALDSWSVVHISAPLRPTTDADRERVGLKVEPAPADVDPDEVLAKVLYHAVSPFDGGDDLVPWDEVTYRDVRDHWLGVARAAREHLRDEMTAEMWRGISRVEDEAEGREAHLKAKADGYDALRHDVRVESGSRVAAVAAAAQGILDRHDEPAAKGEQS